MDAKAYIEDGRPGFVRNKLPVGSVIRTAQGRLLTVERSNGYGISGYWDGVIQRAGSIDLRLEDATIISLPDFS